MSLPISPRVMRSVITDVLPAVRRRDTIYTVGGKPVVGQGDPYTPNHMHKVWAVVGDSRVAAATLGGSIQTTQYFWLNILLQLSGYSGEIAYYGGVSGERTDQIAARVTTAASMPAVTDVYLKAGINDIASGYLPVAGSGTIAFTNMKAYVLQLLGAGKAVLVDNEEGAEQSWPSATPPTWSAAMSQEAAIYNRLMKDFCKGTANVTYVDFSSATLDKTSATNKFVLGIKYDGIHDAVGGSIVKAQYVFKNYPSVMPFNDSRVNPSFNVYSGDNTNPVQLLTNPGFTTRTGGILSAGGATLTAWAATTVVAAKVMRLNGNNLYYTVAGGTTGSTAPVHTSGTVSDGSVLWTFVLTTAGGSTYSIPDDIEINISGGATYAVGTNVTADNAIEIVVAAFFSAAGSTVNLDIGSNAGSIASFTSRQLVGSEYVLQTNVQVDDHTNLGTVSLQWNRGDMSTPPRDGYATAAYWTDNQNTPRFTGGLGTYPMVMTKRTTPFVCDAQGTGNGNVLGTPATWNIMRTKIEGAGAGFAICRVRDMKMIKVS